MYDYKHVVRRGREVTPMAVVGEIVKGLVVLALIIFILLIGLSSARANEIDSMMEARVVGVCPEDGPNKLVFVVASNGKTYSAYVDKEVYIVNDQTVIIAWSTKKDISIFAKVSK